MTNDNPVIDIANGAILTETIWDQMAATVNVNRQKRNMNIITEGSIFYNGSNSVTWSAEIRIYFHRLSDDEYIHNVIATNSITTADYSVLWVRVTNTDTDTLTMQESLAGDFERDSDLGGVSEDVVIIGMTSVNDFHSSAGVAADHGDLGGLGDDDHPQYVLKSGNLNQITTRSHTVLSDIGANAHSVIDTHLGASNPHSAVITHVGAANPHSGSAASAHSHGDSEVDNTITLTNITQITNRSHTNLGDIGSNSHTTIDTHLATPHIDRIIPFIISTYNGATIIQTFDANAFRMPNADSDCAFVANFQIPEAWGANVNVTFFCVYSQTSTSTYNVQWSATSFVLAGAASASAQNVLNNATTPDFTTGTVNEVEELSFNMTDDDIDGGKILTVQCNSVASNTAILDIYGMWIERT